MISTSRKLTIWRSYQPPRRHTRSHVITAFLAVVRAGWDGGIEAGRVAGEGLAEDTHEVGGDGAVSLDVGGDVEGAVVELAAQERHPASTPLLCLVLRLK